MDEKEGDGEDDLSLKRWAFVVLFRNQQDEKQQRRALQRLEAADLFWQIWQEQGIYHQIASEEVRRMYAVLCDNFSVVLSPGVLPARSRQI